MQTRMYESARTTAGITPVFFVDYTGIVENPEKQRRLNLEDYFGLVRAIYKRHIDPKYAEIHYVHINGSVFRIFICDGHLSSILVGEIPSGAFERIILGTFGELIDKAALEQRLTESQINRVVRKEIKRYKSY